MASQPFIMAASAARHFRFLDLPPEIRNQIYKQVLGAKVLIAQCVYQIEPLPQERAARKSKRSLRSHEKKV
jgi:hypothetical protein